MRNNIIYLTFVLFLFSCKRLIEVNPPITSVTSESVFNEDVTAIAVVNALYSQISQTGYQSTSLSIPSLSSFAGLSADELSLSDDAIIGASIFNITQSFYYTNKLSASVESTYGGEFWFNLYNHIFIANSIVEGVYSSKTLTPSVKSQLLGEAKFSRALFYFYLVNLYGDVPLALSTDYKVNSSLPRTLKSKIYDYIISDLKEAQTLLSDLYLDGTLTKSSVDRIRPTRWSATALLARIFLYTEKWREAEEQATNVLKQTSLYDTVPLSSVFNKNSKEAIWQLQPVNLNWNTEDAKLFILPSTGPNTVNSVYLSNFLVNSFENGDLRKSSWVNSVTLGSNVFYYPYKYKIATQNTLVSEFLMMFRIGEQYLIRSEARAQQDNILGGQDDLNVIRKRSGLGKNTSNNKEDLLKSILKERRVELFTELGHRWFDLKRTQIIDSVMTIVTPAKGGASWNSYQKWYPIPLSDIRKNLNLEQNIGYTK